jgi:hypothetical protein
MTSTGKGSFRGLAFQTIWRAYTLSADIIPLGETHYHLSWEVAEIVGICKANGYIQPTAYQGIYNAIHRYYEMHYIICQLTSL